MATIVHNIAGRVATHTVSALNVTDLIETYKAMMPQYGVVFPDGEGGFLEPTIDQIANFVGQVYLHEVMKKDVKRWRVRNQTATLPPLPEFESVVS